MKLYSVGFARSNRHRPHFPLGLAGADSRVARAWGVSDRLRLGRLRAPNVANFSTASDPVKTGGPGQLERQRAEPEPPCT